MKIKTGHRRYWEVLEAYELGNLGESRPNERQIVLAKDDKERSYTLIHELIHCASFDEEIELTENQVRLLELWIKKFIKYGGIDKLKLLLKEHSF